MTEYYKMDTLQPFTAVELNRGDGISQGIYDLLFTEKGTRALHPEYGTLTFTLPWGHPDAAEDIRAAIDRVYPDLSNPPVIRLNGTQVDIDFGVFDVPAVTTDLLFEYGLADRLGAPVTTEFFAFANRNLVHFPANTFRTPSYYFIAPPGFTVTIYSVLFDSAGIELARWNVTPYWNHVGRRFWYNPGILHVQATYEVELT